MIDILGPGHEDAVALVDAASGQTLRYGELRDRVGDRGNQLSALSGNSVLLGAQQTVASAIDVLSLISIGATTALLDPKTDPVTLASWRATYRPSAVIGFDHETEHIESGTTPQPRRPERVLLATSGSTGNPKFVRLTEENLDSNAHQIRHALGIDPEQRALAHLPLYYSYGLSVLTSHLAAGSAAVLTSASAIRPDFWDAMRTHDVTTLPGVPYSYEMYRRAGLATLELPALRHLTQAGGRMPIDRVLQWHSSMASRGVSLWVMYGQTEATARMSVLPTGELPEAAGSVGYAIAGGSFSIDQPGPDGSGEIVYRGNNVMLGYASGCGDLDGTDELAGTLRTGDLGRLDEQGRLWVTGRLKRIAKVFGTRVSLDDIESRLGDLAPLVVVENGEGVRVFVVGEGREAPDARELERRLRLPTRSVRVAAIEDVPRTPAGKVDYQELKRR